MDATVDELKIVIVVTDYILFSLISQSICFIKYDSMRPFTGCLLLDYTSMKLILVHGSTKFASYE